MSETLIFELAQKAKTGGDKYICKTDKAFIIYLPQNLSRENAEPKQEVSITITKDGMGLNFKLDKEATKSGGDKYMCETDNKFIFYVPQYISRQSGKTELSLRLMVE